MSLTSQQATRHYDVVVIGAGFSGLYALYRLRDVLGLSVQVFETAPTVGGTWYWNRYPGARCDTESFVYCYSFSRELWIEWDWSGRYPFRDEILRYLEHVADRFDLRRNITFKTSVSAARWLPDREEWEIETTDGSISTARYIVTAIGSLTAAPYLPTIPGLDDYQGSVYHTSRWPDAEPNLVSKTVGVVGTGSTGAQLIPTIANRVHELIVFQRTAQFMIPAREEVIDREYLRNIKGHYEDIWERARWSIAGHPWESNGRSAWDDTAEQRRATFERLWVRGGQNFVGESYKDVLTDPDVSKMVAEFIREKIRERVRDRATAEKLTPRSHMFGSRRVIIESDYFEVFNRPNVKLVDVEADPIARLSESGVVLESGVVVPADTLIFATGFDAVTGPFFKIDVRGRDGERLEQTWAAGPASYLGMAVAGYPNMFMVTGPGSTFGNHPVLMEHQVEWICSAIDFAIHAGNTTVEAAREAQIEWHDYVDKEARATVQYQTKSWFTGANIPGKPTAPYVYLGSYRRYRKMCDRSAQNKFEGLLFDGSPAQ